MSFLLWQVEYGKGAPALADVPAEVIWQKMLTAPDSSSLNIFHHGTKVGFCHWATSVGDEGTRNKTGSTQPEGMVQRVGGYRVAVEGNLGPPALSSRARFDGKLKLATNHVWQDFDAKLNLRPNTIEVNSIATDQTLRVRVEDTDGKWERAIPFSELQQPEVLARDLAGPLVESYVSALGILSEGKTRDVGLGLSWEGRLDSLKVGHSQIRVYRLRTRLLDRFQVVVYVSRVGEILRLELPDEIVLVNDQLTDS